MNKQPSSRIREIMPSGIRRIFDIACANPDGIDLSIGTPDFAVPEAIQEAAKEAIANGHNAYISTRGLTALRSGLTERLKAKNLKFDDLLITSGATGGYYLAILATIAPGDEVLIFDPYFVAYANVVIMCGGIPKFVNTYPDFKLSADAILPHITKKTRAILINNPGNPTGVVYSADELGVVADIAEKYALHVISDEIYDEFVSGDSPFVSMGNLIGDAIVISGFSKTFGITGWRLGHVTGSQKMIDAMATFQQYSYVCANSVAQHAAVAALDVDMSGIVRQYESRRDRVYNALKENFKMRKPGGAFYLFPEAPGGSANDFVNAAIERKVFVIPGAVFSNRDSHFRISIASSENKLDKAAIVLNELATQFS